MKSRLPVLISETSILDVWSATLTLPDYGRVARYPPELADKSRPLDTHRDGAPEYLISRILGARF
jgi:hypothetical protein